MASKKKSRRKRDGSNTDKSEQAVQEKQGSDKTSQEKNKWVLPAMNFIFVILMFFFLWNTYAAITKGLFSNLAMLAVAAAGLFVAIISRQLTNTGYFQYYRILSIIFFLQIAVFTYTYYLQDGYIYGILNLLSAALVLATLLPLFFEGIDVKKVAIICIGSFVGVLFIILMMGTKYEVPREKILPGKNLSPISVAFDSDNEYAWVYGDDLFMNQGKNTPDKIKFSFRIHRSASPDKVLHQEAEVKLKELQKFSQRGKKKKKDKKEEEKEAAAKAEKEKEAAAKDEKSFFEIKASRFSYSADRKRKVAAVAAINNDGNNSLFVIDFRTLKKTVLLEDPNAQYIFPWKSRTYPDYSTWSPDGLKFFFFTKEESGYRAHVADLEAASHHKLAPENVLSACWTSKGELLLLTGNKEEETIGTEGDKIYFKNNLATTFFDFVPKGVSIHYWMGPNQGTRKIADVSDDVKVIKVHPLSGRILAFDGQNVSIYHDSKGSMEKKPCADIPSLLNSGLSPDGKQLLVRAGDAHKMGMVKIVNLQDSGEKIIEKTTDFIGSPTFSPDGRYILYTSNSIIANLTFFSSQIKIYDNEKNVLYKIVPSLATAARNANITLPCAFPINPNNGNLFFTMVDESNSSPFPKFKIPFFNKKEETKVPGGDLTANSIWLIFPKSIILKPNAEESPDGSKETPEETASPSPSPTEKPLLKKEEPTTEPFREVPKIDDTPETPATTETPDSTTDNDETVAPETPAEDQAAPVITETPEDSSETVEPPKTEEPTDKGSPKEETEQ